MESGAKGLFIGLGFQKCATTQITTRLSRHPEIWTHPVRELRYWNTLCRHQKLPRQTKYQQRFSDRLREVRPSGPVWRETARNLAAWEQYTQCRHDGADDYLRLFDGRDPQARAFGEISPNYALLTAGEIAMIYDALARPKLFVIMRAPVARVLSQINHESRLRSENVSSPERQLAFLDSAKVRRMSDYPGMIRALRALPDQQNVGLFFFEDFTADMDGFFRSFCAFLGVPYDKVLAREIRSGKQKSDYRAKLAPEVIAKAAELYGGMGAEVARLVGRTPAAWDVERPAEEGSRP